MFEFEYAWDFEDSIKKERIKELTKKIEVITNVIGNEERMRQFYVLKCVNNSSESKDS